MKIEILKIMERELSIPNCSSSVNIAQFISLVPNTPTNPVCPINLISCLTLLAQLTMQSTPTNLYFNPQIKKEESLSLIQSH